MQGKVVSINIASSRGEKKTPASDASLLPGYGVVGDAHAGSARQVSLLASESVVGVVGSGMDLGSGDFGENITTEGIAIASLQRGSRLRLGGQAVLQISEIGKVCNSPCSIGQRLGDCVMPREGVFAKVLRGGRIAVGDSIETTSVKIGAVVTSSDRCASGERSDESGPALVRLLSDLGIDVADYSILPDEANDLRKKLVFLSDSCGVDLILTTGGTGLTPRDRAPEATAAVLDSQAPGIAEAIRHEGLKHTLYACISRGVSGIRGRTLIINLPGSSRAISQVSDLLGVIIPHALDAIRMEVTDCGTTKQPMGVRQ